MSIDLAFDAWKARAAERPIDDVARMLQLSLKKIAPREFAGACPRPGCGGKDRFAINLTKNVYNCRHCGGGDGIGLVMMARSLDFVAACEFINGEPPPDRDARLSADDAERLAREAQARAAAEAKRQNDENEFRELERGRLYEIWHRAEADAPELAAYLKLRLGADVAPPPRLRLVRDMPYYSQGADRGVVLARAPAMLAPIVDANGRFRGLHFTYLDLARPNGKLQLANASGEPQPAKKVRGSKEGHWIELTRIEAPRMLIIGEGIEKVLAVQLARARAGHDLSSTAFWTSVDLGNLGGPHAGAWTHPTLKTAAGRPQRVPGPVPKLDKSAIIIPDSVEDLVLLGDSASDHFTTQCALARATARYAREGRTVRVAWAPKGKDFDDVLREEGGSEQVTSIFAARKPIEALPPPDARPRTRPQREKSGGRPKPAAPGASVSSEAAVRPSVGRCARGERENNSAATSVSSPDSLSPSKEKAPPNVPDSSGFDVETMNEKGFALVLMGSKAVVFFEQPAAPIEDQKRILTRDAFHAWFANKFTEVRAPGGAVRWVTWSDAWMRSPMRRQYHGIEFHPDSNSEPGTAGYLNLWSGFAVEPAAQRDWRKYKTFRDHLLNNVAGGREDYFKWVFGFFAHIVQRPRERPGTALVLRGEMGSGKTKVGEIIGRLFPRHYFLVDDPRYVTGQFNAHMATCLLLQADEAVWAGDKAAEGRLKGLITSAIQQIEAKGVDPIRLPNYVRLIMTSNEDWVVPAGKDERRFAVLDIDPRCAQNHDYFREMDEELANGGLEALLADLLAFDLASVDLWQIPRTDALLEQKVRSFGSIDSWWFERLTSGSTSRHGTHWREEVACAMLYSDYIGTADRTGVRRKSEETVFGIKMAKLVPGLRRVKRTVEVEVEDERSPPIMRRVWCYQLPPLQDARELFERALQQRVDWPSEDDAPEPDAETRDDPAF